MHTDRYTKAVLTVIAGCLLWICAMGSGPSLAAQPAVFQTTPNLTVQPVVLVGTGTLGQNGIVTVNYVRQPDGVLRAGPTLPVTLPYTVASPLPVGMPYSVVNPLPAQVINMGGAPLPVEVSGVSRTGTWDPIRVRVEPGTQSTRPGGGGQ